MIRLVSDVLGDFRSLSIYYLVNSMQGKNDELPYPSCVNGFPRGIPWRTEDHYNNNEADAGIARSLGAGDASTPRQKNFRGSQCTNVQSPFPLHRQSIRYNPLQIATPLPHIVTRGRCHKWSPWLLAAPLCFEVIDSGWSRSSGVDNRRTEDKSPFLLFRLSIAKAYYSLVRSYR